MAALTEAQIAQLKKVDITQVDTSNGPVSMSDIDQDTDRHGMDFAGIDLPKEDPELCKVKCREDMKCMAWAYQIRNGRIEEMVRPVMLSGNVFKTLKDIDGIGNDLGMNQGGGCGKAGQSPLPVSNGSPHIRIQNCLVSGA